MALFYQAFSVKEQDIKIAGTDWPEEFDLLNSVGNYFDSVEEVVEALDKDRAKGILFANKYVILPIYV